MTNTEYNKLLKYLYFEGYADSYEEADYILEDMSNIERKQLMMEATRMRKYFNKKYGNKNEYGENEAAAKEAITRRKISRNRTPYPHPPIRGSSEHLQFARQKAKSQNEAYELLLDYLIDEGYTNTVDGALTIIENMSEDWMESILDEELTGERKKRALKKGFKHLATAKEGSSVTKNVDKNMPTRRGGGSGIKRNPNRWGRPGTVKPGPAILNRDDRGSGNKAARRAGKKVKDNEDRYYWNDTDPDF